MRVRARARVSVSVRVRVKVRGLTDIWRESKVGVSA